MAETTLALPAPDVHTTKPEPQDPEQRVVNQFLTSGSLRKQGVVARLRHIASSRQPISAREISEIGCYPVRNSHGNHPRRNAAHWDLQACKTLPFLVGLFPRDQSLQFNISTFSINWLPYNHSLQLHTVFNSFRPLSTVRLSQRPFSLHSQSLGAV